MSGDKLEYKPFTAAELKKIRNQPLALSNILPANYFGNDSTPAPVKDKINPVKNVRPSRYWQSHNNAIAIFIPEYVRSVGRIRTKRIPFLGTGFLIHSQAILVSKHAIIDAIDLETGEFTEPLYFYLPFVTLPVQVLGCLEDGAPSGRASAHDYLILKLYSPVNAKVLPLIPHDALNSDKLPFGNLWTLHYPDGKEQRLSIGETDSSNQQKLILDYAMETSHCSSGAPIIDINGLVHGLHRGVIKLQGYRNGEFLQTIYDNNHASILRELSKDFTFDIKNFQLVTISPFLPLLPDDETLEGFFHDSSKPSKLYNVGRHIGSKLYIEIGEGAAKKLTVKQTSDASFDVGVDKHLVEEYNRSHAKKMEKKENGTQKTRLDQAWLDRCHRISAEDIQNNIRVAINSRGKQYLRDFAKLLYQSNINNDAKAECEAAKNLIDEMFKFHHAKQWKERTVAANQLYKHMFRAKFNLSFGHKSTNSGIGQQLDLNFQRNPVEGKYTLTPRSRRIAENSHKFKFTAPKIVDDEVYSSHVIDPYAPILHDIEKPTKDQRTIKLDDIKKDDHDLIIKIK